MKNIKGSAPAKIILFGEHAVVYGEPALAIPVHDVRAYVQVDASALPFRIELVDFNQEIIQWNEGHHPLIRLSKLVIKKIGIQDIPYLFLHVESQIPVASGLGSGAAVSTAIVRALLKWYRLEWSNDAINEVVYEVERSYHGTPSGIDNTVISYEQPIYFVRDEKIEWLDIQTPFLLLIADTGIKSPTLFAVSDVKKLYETDHDIKTAITQIGNIGKDAKNALATGNLNLIAKLMNQNHDLLKTLTVSHKQLDLLVDTAMQAGALGAKLSGGGRGGNMIAMVTEDRVEAVTTALLDAGAVNVLKTVVQRTTV